jgi:molybdopterin synthase sulfur carrier subunit
MARVHVPSSLTAILPGLPGHVWVEAASVRELIDEMESRWPGLRFRVCDAGPVIRQHIKVFVDGERATLATPLKPDSDVHIMAAVSGG